MNKKPTRHECGVGILGFWGMNLKSIQINHRHPATRTNQTSMPIEKHPATRTNQTSMPIEKHNNSWIG